ncbi:MAG: hypothetical protein AB1540_16130 [Bdellovibrionota bacterium]
MQTRFPQVSLFRASLLISAVFLALTLPLAFERPSGGRSAERQGFTAGQIRIFCQEPEHSILKGPQIHFGKNPFTLELPVFEWLQGVSARLIGGPECEAVEPVGKVFSIVVSVLALFVIAFVASELWGAQAGVLAALLLGTQELWLRYSTYTMIENRVLLCGLLGIWFSLKRMKFGAFLFWTLTIVQKPQIFVFCAVFWFVAELLRRRKRSAWIHVDERRMLYCVGLAFAIGVAWNLFSTSVNVSSDLPWTVQTGPRARQWYFGNWADRFTPVFWKSLALDWFKYSSLAFALPGFFLLALIAKERRGLVKQLEKLVLRALPLLVAFVVYKFLFFAVYVVHEYYALPLTVGRALASAGVLAFVLEHTAHSKSARRGALALVVGVVAVSVISGVSRYVAFAREIGNPKKDFYHKAWNVRVFPEKAEMVVMAIPEARGHNLLHLYLAKQRGFVWCAENKAFAPRAFWKAHGIDHIAWAEGIDPKTGLFRFTVRTIDEELALARKKGWSSDVGDVWKGRSMAEWALIASHTGKDPCEQGGEDPRTWPAVGR